MHIDALITSDAHRSRAVRSSRSTARPRVSSFCERVLAQLDGRPEDSLTPDSERTLGAVPQATQWADRFTSNLRPRPAAFRRQAAPHAVSCAVDGAAHALIPDPDSMLRRMLAERVHGCYDPTLALELLERFRGGGGNYKSSFHDAQKLWSLYVFELWYRRFFL